MKREGRVEGRGGERGGKKVKKRKGKERETVNEHLSCVMSNEAVWCRG